MSCLVREGTTKGRGRITRQIFTCWMAFKQVDIGNRWRFLSRFLVHLGRSIDGTTASANKTVVSVRELSNWTSCSTGEFNLLSLSHTRSHTHYRISPLSCSGTINQIRPIPVYLDYKFPSRPASWQRKLLVCWLACFYWLTQVRKVELKLASLSSGPNKPERGTKLLRWRLS